MKLHLENDDIRFTKNGRIAIVDAIAALCGSQCPVCIWDQLRGKNPMLNDLFDTVAIDDDGAVPVADGDSWDIIQKLLFDYLVDREV